MFESMAKYILCLFLTITSFCTSAQNIIVLGVAQDGGYPHAGCTKKCCDKAWGNKELRRHVVSLAVTQPGTKRWWLVEATPDIKDQLNYFRELTNGQYNYLPDGIFITHAHIGHYTGLMQLGREVMNTKEVKVFVLPKMKKYLETNGPWSQLVKLKNIELIDVDKVNFEIDGYNKRKTRFNVADGVGVYAFTVPHRDEYSETAGFNIITKNRQYIFIPDIDKWLKWDTDIFNLVNAVDVALLDGTFYEDGELPGRNINEVPHPFVSETMKLFKDKDGKPSPHSVTSKIHFIHFNHTNPLLWDMLKQNEVRKAGFNIAVQGQKL
jgi:pyrroloquinoline quinone biosynthesis protein B